jgi:hypothetical protein
MELNKSKSILNQKQEDLLTGTWTAVEDALLRKTARSPPDVFYYVTLAPVATATLSPKGTWCGLMLAWSLISTARTGVGAAVATTAV